MAVLGCRKSSDWGLGQRQDALSFCHHGVFAEDFDHRIAEFSLLANNNPLEGKPAARDSAEMLRQLSVSASIPQECSYPAMSWPYQGLPRFTCGPQQSLTGMTYHTPEVREHRKSQSLRPRSGVFLRQGHCLQ